MSVGEPQLPATPVVAESSPAGQSQRIRRWPWVCALLFGLGILAYSFQREGFVPLSAEETRLVGTWDWQATSGAGKVSKVIFNADRSLVFPGTIGLDSKWKVVNDRLKITHYYKRGLFRGGPDLPFKKAESFYFTLLPTGSPDRISVKAEQVGVDSTLNRSK